MKKHARLYDEEMTVRALRWRRPRLVLALLGWSGAFVVFLVAGLFLRNSPVLEDVRWFLVGWCLGAMGLNLLRIVRINRRLEEIDP